MSTANWRNKREGEEEDEEEDEEDDEEGRTAHSNHGWQKRRMK